MPYLAILNRKKNQPVSILNKATSLPNRDLDMDDFPIWSEHLLEGIFSDIGVKGLQQISETKETNMFNTLKINWCNTEK